MDFPLWARVGSGAGIAAVAAYLTTPLAIAAARRFAFYDTPAGYKTHARPTPYLGGAAVMVAFALAVAIGAGDPERTVPLLASVIVLLVVGTIDDRRTVSPWVRIAVELAVGVALSASGLGWRLELGGAIDGAATAVWVLAVVNAFNLFDNMDGAASTMALVVCGSACILAIVTGDVWVAASSAAMCGACLGFLPHNLASPAKIFLGDGGSMPLGLAAAALVAMSARSAEGSLLALLLGLMLVGVPVLDTCLVIVSRRRRGASILNGGRDHLTHRTNTRIRSARRVALALGGAQALVSTLVIVASRQSGVALVSVALGLVACATATIVALEPITVSRPESGAPSGEAVPADRDTSVGGGRLARHSPQLGLALLALGAGISPLVRGYYDEGVWVSLGLVLMIIGTATAIARPPSFSGPALLTFSALAGLGLWSLLSANWAAGAHAANTEANIWLSYAALFLIAIGAMRGPRGGATVLIASGAGIGIVALIVLVRMLGSDPGTMFLGGRLNTPLGYVNGQGCVFAMGAWLGIALAERKTPLVAGAGAAATVTLLGLTLLSESRGAAIATSAAALIALAVIPGARRRVLLIAIVAAALAAVAPAVTRVYQHGALAPAPPSVVHSAAIAMLVAAALAGAIWAGLVATAERISTRGAALAARMSRAVTIAATMCVLAPIAVALASLPTIEHQVSTQWHAFVHVTEASAAAANAGSDTRLFSGAGNRYDYWRIAWRAFLDRPLAGVGAGNFSGPYFRDRRTTEAVENPHSIELQTLAELGLVGAVLLAALLAGVALSIRRVRIAAARSPAARTTMVAATGIVVVWVVDTSGDWMHLIPGVSAIALLAIAVLCCGTATDAAAAAARPALPRGAPRARRLVGVAAIVLVMAVGGASLLRADIVRRYLDDTRAELSARPADAIVDAGRALRLDSASLDAYYLEAAGLARFDDAAAARTTLLDASREDPSSFVTWALLGDLEVRAGNLQAARTYYLRAHRLDPRDPSLAASAASPQPPRNG